MYIETGNRKIIVMVHHCGIDMKFMSEMLDTEEFRAEYAKMKEKYKDKFVLGATDRLSPLSGISEKFASYKKFIKDLGPDVKKPPVLIQVFLVIHK